MPANKLALIRYKTIDKCLQNRFRKWTLENLIDSVSEALYEYEGIDSGISKRTVQLDIQNMRSDKLGYSAPIIVVDRKYYTYEDKEYSITRSNLSHHDLEVLNDTIKLLGQFEGFHYFEDLATILGKLENKANLQSNITEKYIDFEKNELLKGLHWVDPLLKGIKNKTVVEILYQSFKAKTATAKYYNPLLLKEFRNRWFLLCTEYNSDALFNLALDRMEAVESFKTMSFKAPSNLDPQTYYDDVIGVTKSRNQRSSKVVLRINRENAPYVITKPLHSSQQLKKKEADGIIIISIEVILNLELERLILGFGPGIEVLSPKRLRNRIKGKHQHALDVYQN